MGVFEDVGEGETVGADAVLVDQGVFEMALVEDVALW